MENLNAHYPSFMKNQPLIWGISLSDLFILSGVLFVMMLLGANEMTTLATTIAVYLLMISARRLFPRRHFEFVLISKNTVTRKDLNEKLLRL
ncbi:MAG: hypothetical protein K2Q18_11010 [Bdellovibrionales bacterium]|nr:hypothetical protein [Bdellovibrionales bacterium]